MGRGPRTASVAQRSAPLRPVQRGFSQSCSLCLWDGGTTEEREWALAKARYDAETFWYRGNGSVDVVCDTAFDPGKTADRNVILYGNADTNAAWRVLLGPSSVQVTHNRIGIGAHELRGNNLACLFIQPRPGSDRALVGAVGGSGPAGMRLTDRLPYFVSGVGYPDCIVMGPETLSKGSADVRVAGFFGLDWSVNTGEFVWTEPASEESANLGHRLSLKRTWAATRRTVLGPIPCTSAKSAAQEKTRPLSSVDPTSAMDAR